MPDAKAVMIDDQANDYRQWSEELSSCGIKVDATSDPDEAVGWIKEGEFDFAIVDLEMPGKDGITTIRAIHEVDPSLPVVILSGYHHLDKWKTAIDNLSEGISFVCMEKPFPPTTSPSFDKVVIKPIRQMLAEGATRVRRKPGVSAGKWDEARSKPFDVDLDSYLALSLEQKADLQREARRRLGDSLVKLLDARGAQWVLICGDPGKPAKISSRRSRKPTTDEILRIAKRYNRAPYLFERPVRAEEIGFDKWHAVGEEDWYPTVGLMFPSDGKKPEDTTLALHFDTGSAVTYVSYERLRQLEAIAAGLLPLSGVFLSDGAFEYTFFDVSPTAICTDGTATCKVKPQIQAVVNWEAFPLAARYGGRVGLAGRSLLCGCGLTVVLDGKARQTRLQKQ